MKRLAASVFCAAVVAAGGMTAHALSLTPLSSFGGGDGWLAPNEMGFNAQTNATVRGFTYNSTTNRLYVVDRDGGLAVDILDGDTGMMVGSLDTTGITGGTFVLSMIDVADDGAIYAANLSTSATANFKVYRWENEAAVPTIAFDGLANRIRTGDSFAVTGAGAATKMVAAGGSNAGQDYALFTTGDGMTFSVSNPVATGAAMGAFRLGIDIDAGTVVGLQTGGNLVAVAEAGGAASVVPVNSLGEAPLAWDASANLLATVDINTSAVRLYDTSDLTALTTTGFLDIANNTTAFVSNGNGVGDLKFGRGPDGSLRLYALNANNGIQAFQVIPEPTSCLLALGLGLAGIVRRRR
jgi:hypothetical protein